MTTPAERELARQKGKSVAQGFDFSSKSTNIDRRHAQRVRPMEVLGLGLGRTGTVSMRAALLELGYWDTHHVTTPMIENTSDCKLWYEAYDAKYFGKGKPYGKREFDGLLGHCMALVDVPCIQFAQELVAAYPDAKIILTVRDSPDAWLRSWKVNFGGWLRLFYFPSWNPWLLFVRAFSTPLGMTGMFDRQFKAYQVFVESDINEEIYHSHNRMIRRLAGVPEDGSVKRTDKFLEYNVKQGWAPLCDFLGKHVPQEPFPNVNDTKQFQERLGFLWQMQETSAKANARRYLPALAVVGAAGLGLWFGRNDVQKFALRFFLEIQN